MNRNRQLDYVQEKLNSIITNHTRENLLVFTDDKQLTSLLISINKLLNSNQEIFADYIKNKETTKRMISNISHDLKTPLTVITGYLEMVSLNESITIEDKKRVGRAHEKAVELQMLMNEFFDLAKIESGDTEFALEKVNLNEICRKSMLDFYEMLTEYELEISINLPNENLYTLGNEEMLIRALNNLISNAITYGYQGNVIGLNLFADDNFNYIEVWDKGKGIEEKDQEKIFERLYTLEDSRNKEYQGSGLGLTITKRLIENLAGNVQVSSKPHEQTIFTIQLKKLAS